MVSPPDEETTQNAKPLEPINIRLKDLSVKGTFELTPRGYQTELCAKALEENVIICLGTGLGKTFITVLYLNSADVSEQIITYKKRIVFLAPTQDLVQQQADYINKQVLYQAKVYCGRTCLLGEHIDHWDREIWDAELDKIQILFMTPQIFASAICTNLLDWPRFATIIFDECHHACRSEKNKNKESGHPYAQILKSYDAYYSIRRHEPRPRIIGLSASLINTLPKTSVDILTQIHRVESAFSATCVTDFEAQEAKPKMVISGFTSLKIDENNDYLLSALTRVQRVIDTILKPVKQLEERNYTINASDENVMAFKKRLKLASMGYAVRLPSIGKIFAGLILIRKLLGLWAFRESCHYFLESIQKSGSQFNVPEKTKSIYGDVCQILKTFHNSVDDYLKQQGPVESLLLSTRGQPKALLQILRDEYERAEKSEELTFSCLVFVRSRLEVRSLCKWLQAISESIPDYNFIKCHFAVGLARAKGTFAKLTKSTTIEQTRKLNDFRAGVLNVIVTTPVLEEGIDLPICSTVIRYAEAKTYREYVQSRGRARQTKSSYITMCEAEEKQRQVTKINLTRFNNFESELRLALTEYNIGPKLRREVAASRAAERHAEIIGSDVDRTLYEDDFFFFNDGKGRICSSTAHIVLHMYCQTLSKNQPFTEKIRFGRNQVTSDTHQTTLYLPSSCPISAQGILGRVKGSSELADDSAAVAAVRALYDAKELDPRFCIPFRFSVKNIDNLLERHGLEPKYIELDKFSQGIIRKEGDNEISYYTPKLYEPKVRYLMRNFSQRTYKLMKVRFIPQAGLSRSDTRRYFEAAVFGLIIDTTTPHDFIPSKLFSHYGQFVVQHEIISDNLSFNSQDHREYLYFTHKVLRMCIKAPNIEDLRDNCLFYLILLNKNNQPDISRMRKSFYKTYNDIRVGDVVKVGRIYSTMRQSSNRRAEDNLMVVRAKHTNMNALSTVPRCNMTFREDAEYKYGDRILTRIDQPVFEVMPISRDFGRTQEGKRVKSDYSTSSIYYLEQFLEYFHDEPSHIFQAFNMPEIIYRLYLFANAAELDDRFCIETQERRQRVIMPEILQRIDPSGGDTQELNVCLEKDNLDIGEAQSVADLSDVESNNSESDSDSSTDSDSSLDSDSDELLDEQQAEDYAKRLHQVQIARRNNSPGISQNDENKFTYEDKTYNDPTIILESDATSHIRFGMLSQVIEGPLSDLTRKLLDFKRETPEIIYPGDEQAMEKRNSKIDRSIVPPFSLDRGAKPVRQGRSRSHSILEALTLSRAQESYNLEELENIGDSYLKYVVSVVLFKKLTDVNEGLMALARSRLTCNKYFTHLAKRCKLGPYAITRGFSKDAFAQVLGIKVTGDFEKKKELSMSRMRPKELADIFESIIGSYLLYHGEYEAVLAIEWLKLDLFHDHDIFDELHEDAVVFSRVPPPLIQSEDCHELCRKYKGRIENFETIFGYNFNDPSLLVQAFTHASFKSKCTPSYERLEFLGDSILDYLVTQTLLASTPETHWTPGQLTSSRSALVNNTAFARLAIQYSFDLFVLHESMEVHTELARVRLALDDEPNMEFFDMIEFDSVVKLLGDLFESVAGAVYLDSGCSLDTVWNAYYPMMKSSIQKEIETPTKNATATLYETYTGKDRIRFEKMEIKQGVDSAVVGVKCFIKGFKNPFEGTGLNYRQAKMRAVMSALESPTDEERKKCQEEYLKKNPQFKPRPDRRPIVRRDARRFHRHDASYRRRY